MLNKLLNKFKGDRKFFTIVFFILALIILSGIITPIVIDSTRNNWDEDLSQKIIKIENESLNLFREKESTLLSSSNNLKDELHAILKPGENSYGDLIQTINGEKYFDFSVQIFAPNGRMIAWNNSIAIPEEELFPLDYPPGSSYFHSSQLRTFLTHIDTVLLDNDQFFFALSLPVEKHYDLQNEYFLQRSFTAELSDKFLTEFEIDYTPYASKTKDGRKYSFEILNSNQSKIGIITFLKPSITTEINGIQNKASTLQSVLVALACLFAGLGFRRDYLSIKYRSVKFLIFAFYLTVFRALLYVVSFPSSLIDGPLADPTYYSSAFGMGVVRSPLEFFITAVFLLLLSIIGYRYLLDYIYKNENKQKKIGLFYYATVVILAVLFFVILRGFVAAVKSVIFDSTLRYFSEASVLPDFPAMVMNLNALLLGLSTALILCSFLFYLFLRISQSGNNFRLSFLMFFIFFESAGLIFISVQKEPLISPFLSLFITAVLFFLSYQIFLGKKSSVYNYVFYSLAASVITISLMNHFNLKLEKEALKTTALEINRPNENLLRYLLTETLTGAVKSEDNKAVFRRKNINYDAAAFRIWSGSPLQRESLESSVSLLSKEQSRLGTFSAGIENNFPVEKYPSAAETLPIITELKIEKKNSRVFYGISPVVERSILLGYISAAVEYDLRNIGAAGMPEFLESRKNLVGSVVDTRQLKIFEIDNGRLENVYGDIYPSREQTEPIVSADFSDEGEAWLDVSLNNEDYTIYALQTYDDENVKITAVALREKQLTWELFNFFKIFIVHSIFILIFAFVLFALSVRKFKLTFRAQLLIAFLIISILPVIILAVYNREAVNERSASAVFTELNERAEYIENHIRMQKQKHPERPFLNAFENAGKELGISFGVYDYTNQIFNSKPLYYSSGFFDSKLNSTAHYQLNYLSYREYLTSEQIETFRYSSFYRKIAINNDNFILGVNDAFNKVRLSFSPIDVDVFLFGVYSFAVLVIITISTLLANKISDPVRRLTRATEAVAQGDLSIQLENKEIGEMKDLLSGFNSMTKELQKNQLELAALERENAWKEMAKQVAHEIKNPLTPMKLAVQQMKIAYRDKAKDFENMLDKISATLLNQIENLNVIASEFSRFAKMPSLNLERVELVSVMNDTLNLFTDEKVRIIFDYDRDPAFVEADKSQLRRMAINLIRNSIQADSSEIKISLKENQQKFELTFSDNGTGILPENRDKIFESSFTTKEKGMGIGLKLSKRFVEGINGSIELLSSSPEGTTFMIKIPVLSGQKT